MHDNGLGRVGDYKSNDARGCSHDRDISGREEAPRPSEVLYEIGMAIAAFLGVAVLAQLLVVAIHAG